MTLLVRPQTSYAPGYIFQCLLFCHRCWKHSIFCLLTKKAKIFLLFQREKLFYDTMIRAKFLQLYNLNHANLCQTRFFFLRVSHCASAPLRPLPTLAHPLYSLPSPLSLRFHEIDSFIVIGRDLVATDHCALVKVSQL